MLSEIMLYANQAEQFEQLDYPSNLAANLLNGEMRCGELGPAPGKGGRAFCWACRTWVITNTVYNRRPQKTHRTAVLFSDCFPLIRAMEMTQRNTLLVLQPFNRR